MARVVCPAESARITIDLDALRHNFDELSRCITPAELGAVVKANAYGLGAIRVAETLQSAGCRQFFTAHLSEALELLSVLEPASVVFILNGLDSGCEPLCADYGFIPVLNSVAQVQRWQALAIERRRRLPAALQVDSGMSRLGLSPGETLSVSKTSLAADLDLKLVLTHLACADDPNHIENRRQLSRFGKIASLFPGVPKSIANSGGVYLGSEFHKDIARCGIALFGVSPPTGGEDLKPIMRFDARVVQIRNIEAGAGVGYGLDYIAPKSMRTATIGVGYADGVPRRFSQCGAAWFQAQRLPLLGRISMDSFTLDASDLPEGMLHEGDFVELIGPHQPIEVVAEAAKTIPYEILTGLGRRAERIYLERNLMERYGAGAWS